MAVAKPPPSTSIRCAGDGSTALVRIEISVSERLSSCMAEESRGQVSVSPADFAMLPQVLNEFETCEHTDTDKLGNKKFLLTKEIDGTWYVVTIQRGKRKLQVKTMWKRNVPGASCQPQSGSLGPTSETTPVSESSIPPQDES